MRGINECFGYSRWEWVEILSGILRIPKARALIGDFDVKRLREVFDVLQDYPKGYPYQYILRRANFYGFEFYVDERVLIPRSDTEGIIDIAKELAPKNGWVLDLCTGSGIIGITLKILRPDLRVFLTDKSLDALKVAKLNAKRFGVDAHILACDLLSCFKGRFDIIVSNPPYIPENLLGKYDKKVLFEPKIALIGGKTGFEITKRILEGAKSVLKKGGYLVIETDPQHFDRFPKGTRFYDRFAVISWETLLAI
ncbi:MAG: peptide chain release factor N(5)-glutamine methyltransferase [candidate division WOR-3 bacterium]